MGSIGFPIDSLIARVARGYTPDRAVVQRKLAERSSGTNGGGSLGMQCQVSTSGWHHCLLDKKNESETDSWSDTDEESGRDDDF